MEEVSFNLITINITLSHTLIVPDLIFRCIFSTWNFNFFIVELSFILAYGAGLGHYGGGAAYGPYGGQHGLVGAYGGG